MSESLVPRKVETCAPTLLEVKELTTAFAAEEGIAYAVNRVSLAVRRGETKGIVGESGSGKSMLCRSILGLVPWPGEIVAGSIRLDGDELIGMSARELRKVRGSRVSMIFQDPTSALNPVFTVGEQIAETIRVHRKLNRAAARRETIELLGRVGIPAARDRYRAYPHELSGGMRQRAMIAIALSCQPDLILADEPTTNLDVTIQDQILRLLADLQAEYGLAMILVSHDLGVVAQNADSVAVMYAGYVFEEAETEELFERPRHPYTAALLQALPRLEDVRVPRALLSIAGQPPSLAELEPGCPFQPRCTYRVAACGGVDLTLTDVGPRHNSACPIVTAPRIAEATPG
jgi:oligopeptide/dipeptide ABC transporter ATP-binding protein